MVDVGRCCEVTDESACAREVIASECEHDVVCSLRTLLTRWAGDLFRLYTHPVEPISAQLKQEDSRVFGCNQFEAG